MKHNEIINANERIIIMSAMDKDYILTVMVSVREKTIDVNEAVENIWALAENKTSESNTKALSLQNIMPSMLCIEDCFENKQRLLTKGKKYKQLCKHGEIIAVIDDIGELEAFHENYFK